jgi:hypothetical protein
MVPPVLESLNLVRITPNVVYKILTVNDPKGREAARMN